MRCQVRLTRHSPQIEHHILLPWASQLPAAAAAARLRLTPAELTRIVDLVPDAWLTAIPSEQSTVEKRATYVNFFVSRLQAADIFEQEAIRAHARLS